MDETNNKEQGNKKNKKKNKLPLWQVVLLIFLLIGIIISSFYMAYEYKNQNKEKELAYTELIEKINTNEVEKIEMTTGSNSVTVTLKGEGEEKERQKTVLVPSLQAFIELVQEKVDKEDLKIDLSQKSINPALRIADTVFSMLPTILLIALIVMMFKMQGLGGDNGKVYGASMTGMPHAGLDSEPAREYTSKNRSDNYGDGINYDSVKNNGADGHVDIHFLNSKTHSSNKLDAAHQNNIQMLMNKFK